MKSLILLLFISFSTSVMAGKSSEALKSAWELVAIPLDAKGDKKFKKLLSQIDSMKVLVSSARMIEGAIYPQAAEDANEDCKLDKRFWRIVRRLSEIKGSEDYLEFIAKTLDDGGGKLLIDGILERKRQKENKTKGQQLSFK